MDLITDWYENGENMGARDARIVEALRFIPDASGDDEERLIDIRDRLHAEIVANEGGSPSNEQRSLERQLIEAHSDALDSIASESCDAIAEAVETVEAGDYLYSWDDGTDESRSMPRTMGDDVADDLCATLRARGLDFRTDDIGWLVYDTSEEEES